MSRADNLASFMDRLCRKFGSFNILEPVQTNKGIFMPLPSSEYYNYNFGACDVMYFGLSTQKMEA